MTAAAGLRFVRALGVEERAAALSWGRHCFLGLDINTNSTGVAVVSPEGRAVHMSAVDTRRCRGMFETADAVGAALRDVAAEVGESRQWAVAIEAPLRGFSSGRFHTQGLFQLAQLNGIVAYECRRLLGAEPYLPHPSAVRGLFKLRASRSAEPPETIKDVVFDWTAAREPGHEWERGQRSGKLSKGSYDIADAYLIAQYGRQHARADALVSSLSPPPPEAEAEDWTEEEAALIEKGVWAFVRRTVDV